MYGLVDEHRSTHGVEPICDTLQIAPSAYRRHAARRRDQSLLSPRSQRDADLMPKIEQVWSANLQVYGADKVWKQMNREGQEVARCTVERLMRRLLRDIHEFASAVVALARITLGVLVGQHRSMRVQHARTRIILRGDELEVVLLAAGLLRDCLPEFRIETFKSVLSGIHFGAACR